MPDTAAAATDAVDSNGGASAAPTGAMSGVDGDALPSSLAASSVTTAVFGSGTPTATVLLPPTAVAVALSARGHGALAGPTATAATVGTIGVAHAAVRDADAVGADAAAANVGGLAGAASSAGSATAAAAGSAAPEVPGPATAIVRATVVTVLSSSPEAVALAVTVPPAAVVTAAGTASDLAASVDAEGGSESCAVAMADAGAPIIAPITALAAPA